MAQPKVALVKPHSILTVRCPICDAHEFRIEHVLGRLAGPWYCDFCGAKTTIDTRDYATCGEVLVTSDPTTRRVWLICELLPQDEPVQIAYSMIDYDPDESQDERESHSRYLIEEHQCPTNITSNIEAVFVGDSDDAHGIFKYLRTVPARVREEQEQTGNDAGWVEQHAPGLLKGLP